jgi:hypothetical protein
MIDHAKPSFVSHIFPPRMASESSAVLPAMDFCGPGAEFTDEQDNYVILRIAE